MVVSGTLGFRGLLLLAPPASRRVIQMYGSYLQQVTLTTTMSIILTASVQIRGFSQCSWLRLTMSGADT